MPHKPSVRAASSLRIVAYAALQAYLGPETQKRRQPSLMTTVREPNDPAQVWRRRYLLNAYEPTYDADQLETAKQYLGRALKRGHWAILNVKLSRIAQMFNGARQSDVGAHQSNVRRNLARAKLPETSVNRNSGHRSGQISVMVFPFSIMPRTMRRKCVAGNASPIY